MLNFNQWLENQQVPSVLYHHSNRNNRQSILQHGLQTKYDQTVDLNEPGVIGGIYLSNKPEYGPRIDVWAVHVCGLPVEEDWTSVPEDPQENWYVCYQEIPPNRMNLVSKNTH